MIRLQNISLEFDFTASSNCRDYEINAEREHTGKKTKNTYKHNQR